jgi:RNA polymerase primary sigma factor
MPDFTNSELNSYIKSIKRMAFSLLTREEEIMLSKRAQRGSLEAKNRLFYSNLRLVILIAKKFAKKDINLLDLIQEGNIGLLKAIQKYNYRKMYKFSTYAFWWIRHYIQKFLYNNYRNILIPVKKEEFLRKIEKTFLELERVHNRRPTHVDIAAALNEPASKINYIMNITQPVLSIDKEINRDSQQKYQDIAVPDKKWETENLVAENMMRNAIHKVLESLMDIEKKIIMYRYGFVNGTKYTLKETGDLFHSSPETIRRIEISVLEKIKKNNCYLREYIQ